MEITAYSVEEIKDPTNIIAGLSNRKDAVLYERKRRKNKKNPE